MGLISKLIKTGLALGAAYTAYQAAEKTRVETGSYTGETFGRNFMKQAGLNAGLVAEAVKAQLGIREESAGKGRKEAAPEKRPKRAPAAARPTIPRHPAGSRSRRLPKILIPFSSTRQNTWVQTTALPITPRLTTPIW